MGKRPMALTPLGYSNRHRSRTDGRWHRHNPQVQDITRAGVSERADLRKGLADKKLGLLRLVVASIANELPGLLCRGLLHNVGPLVVDRMVLREA